MFIQTGPGFTLSEQKYEPLENTFSLCLFDSYSRHFGENDFILSIKATEFHVLTFSAGGVPRDFFNEKNVPWLKKG